MTGDYRPISCAQHERLELGCLRKVVLRLAWEGASGRVCEDVLPLDVATLGGAEWLTFRRGNGQVERGRLDRCEVCESAA